MIAVSRRPWWRRASTTRLASSSESLTMIFAVAAQERTRLSMQLDAHDALRYAGARVTFHSRMDVVRAQLGTRLAQRERDPESTSQIIRELRARRPIEAGDVATPLPPATADGNA